jgi:hypothetical protein
MNRSIAAPDLMTAMRWYVSELENPLNSPYALSIDHSPSEQIDGSGWHTTAIVISQCMEHQRLADEISKEMGLKYLDQWKNGNDCYKFNFYNKFLKLLKNYPVLTIILGSSEENIIKYEDNFAQQIGLLGGYRKLEINGDTKYVFGPYIDEDNGEPKTLKISGKHAPMAIYTVASLLHIHTHLEVAISEMPGHANAFPWFQVFSDKPPFDFSGGYAQLMWLLLGIGPVQGKFTWGGFTGADDQQIDLLADNLAGMFNDINKNPSKYQWNDAPLNSPIIGSFIQINLE